MSAAKRKYKPYPKYKDSGVEWLGQVPEHWGVKRLRYCTQLNPSPADLSPDLEVSFLPMEAIGEDGSLKLDQTRLVKEIGTSYTYFADNDVAYAKVTPCLENGKGALMRGLTNGHGFGTSEISILRPISIDGRFLDFIRRSRCFVGPAASMMLGAGGLKRVPELFARDYYSPFPPPAEQTSIANFIERECGRMDKLVEKKQEFIALLKEKRQALITHAVTKGLDPNVEMKDSGVEWLGEVPKHWDVKKISHLSPVWRGASPRPIADPKYFDDEGEYGWVRIEDVSASKGELLTTTQKLSELGASLSVKLEPGMLFLSIAGSVGKKCISGIKCCIHDGFVYFPNLSVDHSRWLSQVFDSVGPFGGLGKLGTQLNLNTETVGSIKIGLPPSNAERTKILDHIDRETTRIEKLISKTQESIDLLKERKTSLITAAVTGQIDVSQSV